MKIAYHCSRTWRSWARTLAFTLAGLGLPSARADGQYLTRPHAEWRTITTPHFAIHFPAEMSEWTRTMAERIEGIHERVSALVGSAPRARVTVLVDDPYNVPNGFVLPFIDRPLIFLWPTPPEPSSEIGHHRGWPEMLAVHEYAHLAHLTRPSRNPLRRRLWSIVPVRVGPIATTSPRWLIEGYATYVEGRLTGSGRPHGVWRAAILRQWALEGKLPQYGQLNGGQEWYGGAMAYLAGSAFLEWLVEQHGDESLVRLWRRMTARQRRSFADAFAGVFGAPPDELYGRFTVAVTERALAVERQFDRSHVVTGETVQRLTRGTGAPTVSRDGSRVAVELRDPVTPSRIVVWSAVDEPEDTAIARARRRALARDPEDVPSVEWKPPPKKVIATLFPLTRVPYENPRFLPDGKSLLVTRSAPVGDGTFRPDLFVWEYERKRVRRVTHGAGIRSADPSPDGRHAVGDRCGFGRCDVVRIDLRTGAVQPLATGAPLVNFYRPRYSPDGGRIVVAVQRDGRWRVALMDSSGRGLRTIEPPDGANRYDAAFLPDGERLVAVSEARGVPNLEVIDPATATAAPFTHAPAAMLAPEPSPAQRAVLFLKLHARGFDLNRIALDSTFAGTPVRIDDGVLAPAAPLLARTPVDSFTRAQVSAPIRYVVGPRHFNILPAGTAAADGWSAGLSLVNGDPVGRLSLLLQGAYGSRGGWRGASLAAVWRGTRPAYGGELFAVRHRPDAAGLTATTGGATVDVDYSGLSLAAQLDRSFLTAADRFRLLASLGEIEGRAMPRGRRTLVAGEYRAGALQSAARHLLRESASLDLAAGRTVGRSWARARAGLALEYGYGSRGVRAEYQVGITGRDAPTFEQFTLGGIRPSLVDATLLSQRIVMPALPTGAGGGRMASSVRVSATGFALTPFFWAGAAGDRLRSWQRVAGVEVAFSAGPVGFALLPAVRLEAGAGYSFDPPLRRRVRGYLSATLRP